MLKLPAEIDLVKPPPEGIVTEIFGIFALKRLSTRRRAPVRLMPALSIVALRSPPVEDSKWNGPLASGEIVIFPVSVGVPVALSLRLPVTVPLIGDTCERAPPVSVPAILKSV